MFAEKLKGLNESERQSRDVAHGLTEPFSFQSADRDQLERVAGFRNDLRLETFLRSDEYDATRRAAREVLLRDRDGRIDVSSGATTRDHQCLHARPVHDVLRSIVVRDSAASPPRSNS